MNDRGMARAMSTNRRWWTLLLIAPVVVAALPAGVLGMAIGWPALGPAVVGLAVFVIGMAALRGTDRVLRAAGAEPADPVAHARLDNLVDGLCAVAGVRKPALYLTDDAAPDALVAGRDPTDAALVVTAGLLDELDRLELEGVIAHELMRIKRNDVAPGTVLSAVYGRLAPVLAPRLAAPGRDVDADIGVSLTRYPPAMASALEKVFAQAGQRPRRPAIAHLWLSATALEERIAALREL